MTHPDAADLALAALGETPDGLARHLDGCDACRAELSSFRTVTETARHGIRPEDIVEPPPSVWAAVAAQTAPPRRPRRRRRALLALAAAVVALGTAGTGAFLLDRDAPDPEAVALVALPGKPGSGSAAIERTSQGLRLSLNVTGLPRPAGFYEVWLLDQTAAKLISVGSLTGDGTADLPLPPDLDLSTYRLVDISLEPFDGDPAHSKNSFVRAQLP